MLGLLVILEIYIKILQVVYETKEVPKLRRRQDMPPGAFLMRMLLLIWWGKVRMDEKLCSVTGSLVYVAMYLTTS